MTATVERELPSSTMNAPETGGTRTWFATHRATLVTLGLLLVVGGLVQGFGMYDAPQRIDDEGTYTAQAWAVFHLHELTHYTYWYDHPPLGWLQMAGYAQVTGAFDRAPYAVAAGREFMLVLQLVSMVLLWVLARRLRMPRWGAGLAVGLFALSPLAVQFHRTVYLDNIATPWVLGAFVLALTPKRRLAGFAGAGLCFAVAALTKETSLVVFPVLAWVLWRNSAGTTRRYAITVATSVFVLAGMFFVLFALLKGEVVPGADRTSLFSGLTYQLADRTSSGSVFSAGTLGNATVRQWLQLDLVLPVLSGIGAVGGLFVRRLRPFAVGYLIMLALVVRPGYLPVPFVIGMLPLAALLVAGVAVTVWERRSAARLGRTWAVAVVTAGVVAASVAAPLWFMQQRGFVRSQADRPMVEATDWMRANLPRDQRILVDDSLWVDLVSSGFPREDVVWFYKPDTDPAVPTGADSYDWVVSTQSLRTFPLGPGTVNDAVAKSRLVASFGSADGLVEIRQVQHGPARAAEAQAQLDDTRRAAAQALARNPRLTLAGPAQAALNGGQVDPRLLTVIAAATATHRLTVPDLPAVPGETGLRRTLTLSAVDGAAPDGAAGRALIAMLTAQNEDYRPQVRLTGALLTLSFPPTGN